MRYPSWSDYAVGDAALHSSLWQGCRFAYCPGLGNTGPKVYELVSGRFALINNYVASAWVYDKGIPTVENTEAGTNTNRASFWTNLAIPNNVASYSLWIYSTGQTTALGNPITSGVLGTTFRMNVSTAGVVSTSWNNGILVRTAPTPLSANTWTHVVSQRTRGGNAVELWVDGQLVDSAATGSTTTSSDSTVISVLARNDSGSFSSRFAGRVDDVRVYSRMLSPDEIKLLASQRAIAFAPRGRQIFRGAVLPTADGGIVGAGVVMLAGATAAATAEQLLYGTVSVTLAETGLSASGFAGLTLSGSSTVALGDTTVVATGSLIHSGSASVQTADTVAAGSGLTAVDAAFSVATDPATAAGSGSLHLSGTISGTTDSSGAVAGVLVLAGTATVGTESTTALATAVQGDQNIGLATPVAGPATCVAVGHLSQTVTAAAVAGPATAVALGGVLGAVSGSGTVTVAGAQGGASGLLIFGGSAVCVTTDTSCTAAGGLVFLATGAAVTDPVSCVAISTDTATGALTVTTQDAILVASGILRVFDLELSGSVPVASLSGRIANESLQGKKLWR